MISIIVVSYKEKKELINCLSSIKRSKTKFPLEVIVVDNDPEEFFKENLNNLFPEVKYVDSKKNLGFGGGNNLGASFAKGEYLFFLNPDTKLFPDTLNNLFRFIKGRNDIGAISPLLLDSNNMPSKVQGSQIITPLKAIFSLSIINKIFSNNIISRKFFLKNWDQKEPYEVGVVPGTAFLIKKEIFKKIRGFDEKYFLFFEEADLAKKIEKISLKNYIVPSAKIIHLGGMSTRQRPDINKIYKSSQFYYFRKWYGLFWAFVINLITSVGKHEVGLFFIFLLALFLRMYRLDETMSFIGDQGWFYLSARDMILSNKFPLVGITASHTWIHQGPYWTYILAILFKFFNFNPVIPGYFTAFAGSIFIFIIYKIVKQMFEKNVAIISSFLYATSPLVLANDRFPYHTTLISPFSLLYIYSIYKWIKGEKNYFIWAVILLGVLYNFELATVSLVGVLVIFLGYGILKRKKWVTNLINKKIFLFTFLGFFSTMLPIFIYDFKNGYLQTFGFLAWILYKIINFPLGLLSFGVGNYVDIFYFLLDKYRLLTLASNFQLAILFLLISFIVFLYLWKTNKKIAHSVLGISFLISFFGYIFNKTSSDAYLPMFFPMIVMISAVFWNLLIIKTKIFGMIILLIFSFMNIFYFLNNLNFNKDFMMRKDAINRIMKLTSGREYNLIGKGGGSQFESFTMNYEYLLWYYYDSSPSKEFTDLKISVEEKNNKILVSKND